MAVAAAAVVWLALLVPPAAAQEDPCAPGTGWRCGYITVPERLDAPAVQLHFNMRLPFTEDAVTGEVVEPAAAVPTALVYTGYGVTYGGGPAGRTEALREALTRAGWAVLLVTVRGTGCSGGRYQPFGLTEALDARYVIDEWIAAQPWASGEVAMVGTSYAAITQLPAAAQRPKRLRAVVPVMPAVDLYRDVTHPGGIPNVGVTAYATAFQNASSGSFAAFETGWEILVGKDPVCAQHLDERAGSVEESPAAQWWQHPTYDEFWRERTPDVSQIDIPVLLFTAFQDTVVGSRAVDSLSGAKKLHAVLFNGGHGEYDFDGFRLDGMASSPAAVQDAVEFLEHYVRGVPNGYDDKPRIRVWWESGRDATFTPGWETTHRAWPVPKTEVTRLHLDGNGTAGGQLVSTLPATPGASTYAAVPATGQAHLTSRWRGGPAAGTWALPAKPGAALTYSTPALTENIAALGPASLDLWVSSTATDTDLQVTLSEVRADGQEVFVQQGWLRASHRALDESLSRETAPYHLHTRAEPLTPGQATPLRVEILPFAHLFRVGSRLRVTIDAPKAVGDTWGMAPSAPATDTVHHVPTNTVHHGLQHPSQLVLATVPAHLLPDTEAVRALPPCGSVYGQPCRPVLQ